MPRKKIPVLNKCSPQQLAQMILDHDIDHDILETDTSTTMNFGQLLANNGSNTSRSSTNRAKELLLALRTIADGKKLENSQKQIISSFLQVIITFKDEYKKNLDHLHPPKGPDDPKIKHLRDYKIKDGELQMSTGYIVRTFESLLDSIEQAQNRESFTAALSNLNKVEELLKTLARKLGISLDEPKREK